MRGGGTKLGIIPNSARPICLDLTRLIRRSGQVHTGVDRVEWAYLEWCLTLERPVYALVRSAFGYILLDRGGMTYARDHLRMANWPRPDVLSRFALKLSPARRGAETALRQRAYRRATPAGLARMLRRAFPNGVQYFNTGHSNLTRRVFGAFKSLENAQSTVLVHDMIPLDWPQFQRVGTVDAFEKRMRIVSAQADSLICNSHQTLRDVQRHFTRFGRMPAAIVAHLGVDLPDVALEAVDVPEPYALVLGTIEPRKNHALLFDVWEKWGAQAPCHLIVCGNRGWNNEAVFARLDTLAANGLPITELNGRSDAQVAALLRSAAVVLFPSFAEGYGLPPLEAAALGIPVICGDLDIYREVLGSYPVYADTAKPYEWTTAIEKVLQSDGAKSGRVGKGQDPFSPPDWDSHFNLVLKHFG